MRNFPTLVKTMYEKLNKYFIDRETQADAMIAFRQVYALIAPISSLKKKPSPPLISFNNLTAKDFSFKVRKE
ncbi:hypothetical protein HKD37_12G033820 [Glycine soja]